MTSFLSKVFGRKKDEKEDSNNLKPTSTGPLLDGKFEAVSPTISPTASKFAETQQQQAKEKEKDVGFSLFRPKSRTSPKRGHSPKALSSAPHLTLNLPVPKGEDKSRALDVVFEADPNDRTILSESVIGERRLNPLETLLLVKACATAIVERGGLETLGVMHPHWYSASEEAQRRLISLFILTLTSKSPSNTLSPTTSPSAPVSSPPSKDGFETEIEYTRSPHDLAAVLRWALRHLQLEGDSFGIKGVDENAANAIWHWYTQFSTSERTSSYPANAFSLALIPTLPPAHLQLLTATLDIISSLAAHAEANGSSGSKLTKFLGYWVLIGGKRTDEEDDWEKFYERWEAAGRVLEHVFLAYVRDEATNNRMPLRLAELVKGYPYTSTKEVSTSPNPYDNTSGLPLLSRPRISTRRYDALFVRLETQLPDFKSPKPKQNKHPLRIIAEAFTADVDLGDDHQSKEVWEQLKKFASSSATTTSPDSPQQGGDSSGENVYSYPTFSKIFSEDTLRLLSFIPVESGEVSPLSPSVVVTPAPVVTSPTRSSRRRSNSLGSTPNGNGKANGKSPTANPNGTTSTATSPTSPNPTSPTDWADFSSAGFGETSLGKNLAATLLDTDVEVTTPPTGSSRRSIGHQQKKQRKTSPFGVVASGLANRRRSSSDSPRLRLHGRGSASEVALSSAQKHTKGEEKAKVKKVGVVQLDEAFVDFWSDALGDSVSANWPTFFLCQFKSGVGLSTQAQGGGPITWLIIEHLYTHPTVPPLPPIPGTEGGPLSLKRPSSPKPSLKSNVSGRKSSTFSFASRRFSFLNRTDGGPKSPTTGGSPGGIGGVATKKKGASGVGSPRIGEMGEVLPEEDEPVPASTKAEDKREVKGLGISGVESTAAPAGSAPISTTAENKTTPDADADVQPIPVVAIQPPSVSQSVASSVFEPISEKPEPSDEDALAPTPASTSASAIPVDVPVDVPVADEEAPQTPKVLPEQVQQDVVRQQPEQNVVVGPSQATDVPIPASVSQDLTSPDIAVPSLATTHESAPQKDVPEGSVVEDKSLGAPVAEPEHQGDIAIVTPAIPDTKESATEDTNVAKSVVGSEVTTPAVVDAPQGSVVIDVPEEDPTSVVNEVPPTAATQDLDADDAAQEVQGNLKAPVPAENDLVTDETSPAPITVDSSKAAVAETSDSSSALNGSHSVENPVEPEDKPIPSEGAADEVIPPSDPRENLT